MKKLGNLKNGEAGILKLAKPISEGEVQLSRLVAVISYG
jgi:hypothetical protein